MSVPQLSVFATIPNNIALQNLLRTITEFQAKSSERGPDLKLLLTTVKEARVSAQTHGQLSGQFMHNL